MNRSVFYYSRPAHRGSASRNQRPQRLHAIAGLNFALAAIRLACASEVRHG